MKRTTIFLMALALLGITQPTSAAEMTLVRNSRPVTAAEAAGGAPTGAMVHDFYATSDADLLSLVTQFNQQVYQHRYGSDSSSPPSEVIAYYPAVGADSFFTMPGSTITLGGGFAGTGPEKIWADLSDDGPQKDFLFGRLTTTAPGSFSGGFYLRGQDTYIQIPFSFTLPGPSGPLSETLSVSDAVATPRGPDSGLPSPNEPEPQFDPFKSAPFSASDTPVTVEIFRRIRPVTREEIADGAPEGYVNEFFVSSSTDVIGIRDVALDFSVYQHNAGLNNRRSHPARLEIYPALSADSFLTTPGYTEMQGGFDSAATGEKTWYDQDDAGSTTEFLFGRLTSDTTGTFSGTMAVRGPSGAVELPFSYLLPGTAEVLASIKNDPTFTLGHSLNAAGRLQTASQSSQVPEPSAILLATFAAAVQLQRLAARKYAGHRHNCID